MKIYSIIVTYNGMQWYDRCFGSLQRSNLPVDIIVIDNASSDTTVEYIKQNYPEIILIESKENLGFAKANNIGMKYALENDANYVFLLNQDAWINQTNTIEDLVKHSQTHPEFAVLSPLQLYGSAQKIEREVVSYFARQADTEDDFISDLYFSRLKDIYSVPYACAVCWLLPIDTLKNIGGFDPIFYHYGEDDNYIHRVKYFGYKIAICPKVSISHDIEFRAKEYRDDNLDWKKYLLLSLADINKDLLIKECLKSRFIAILFQILRCNKKLLQKSLSEYKYIRQIKLELLKSRQNNRIKQANWLF